MKRLCKVLVGVLFVLTALFSCVGCTTKDKVKCAPCTVQEIWTWNETVREEFFPFRINADYFVECTVDGEEIRKSDWDKTELSEGNHEVVFYTVEGSTVSKPVMGKDGRITRESVEYEPKVVVKVNVSLEYEDIYDEEYREANGLWTDPTQEEWYQDCKEEWITGKSIGISDEDVEDSRWFKGIENFFEKLFG